MSEKRVLFGILMIVVLLGTVPALTLAAPSPSRSRQDQATELLRNPSFEGINCRAGSKPPECLDNWTRDTYNGQVYSELYTPQGWVIFWREGGGYGRPEALVIPNIPPFTGKLPRIRSGHYSLKLFTFRRIHDAGYYQVVGGLQPGATVQFSVYGHYWACDGNDPLGYTCGDPWTMIMQVGIDPNGGTDPWSPGIIWSAEQQAPDHFKLIGPAPAQVGEGGTVTVYMRSKAKWAVEHLDAYWDDASLVYASPPPAAEPTAPPPPAAPPGPPPTPFPTPTPGPGGEIVHIVQRGDTLFKIALMYGVDVNQIRQLNASSLGGSDIIHVGQELVIAIPSETPTPTPPPAPPTSEAAPAPAGASVCVLAYHDRDGNQVRDAANEELLPSAEFTVADASGVVSRYTSDGVNEPYCFTGLTPGSYRIVSGSPPGYAPSGAAEMVAGVAESTSIELQFGNVRGEGSGSADEDAEAATDAGDSAGGSSTTRVLATVSKVSGVLVLVLAGGMAVLFVLNQRRM